MPLDTRRCFLFGTEERLQMFATPLKGADSSPSAWGADGTLLNGGGYGFNSFGSHKRYTYEWPQSSSPETAQMMKSYYDGTFGRGLLYFLEPGIYKTNVLPAHWADPSMAINNEAPSLVYNVNPIAVPTSGGATLGLPVTSAFYDLSTLTPQTVPTPDSSVFLPLPEGHTLFLGAFYSSSGSGGVFATPVNINGTYGDAVKLTELANSETYVVTDAFSGIKGVRLWVGRADADSSSVILTAISGRIIESSKVPPPGGLYPSFELFPGDDLFPGEATLAGPSLGKFGSGPWIGGQGHSGCRFSGAPSYVNNGPVEGGRVGFAASFIEVGSWVYG